MPKRMKDEEYLPMKDPEPHLSRGERLKELKLYFVNRLCEDPQHGSPFDIAVLNALDQIEKEHPEEACCPECGAGSMAHDEGGMKCHVCGYTEQG